jgi:anti-sigma B factor antagonist
VAGVYELKEELLDRTVDRRIRVIAIIGELDMAAAPSFEQALLDSVNGNEPVILDLSQVSFMDSTAIGAMLAVRRRAELRPSRFAVVCEAGSEIERTLHYMGLDSAFSIVQSRPQAATELAGA